MGLLGTDRSHWNAPPNWATLKTAISFLFAKCTDGLSAVDAAFPAARSGAHGVGLIFGGYHFAEWGDPHAEAAHFLAAMAPQPGELVALDAEAALPAGVDPVAWAVTFCTAVHDATGAWPLVYMNQSWLLSHNWAPVAAHDGLWLAKYDGQLTGGPLGAFPVMAVKQFSDTGALPGQPGQVDVDEFEGDVAALLRYAVPQPPAPTPAPTPSGVFMTALTDAEQAELLAGVRVLIQQMCGPTATPTVPWPAGGGWQTERFGPGQHQELLSVVDLLRRVDAKLLSALDLSGRPIDPATPDDAFGQVLSLRADVAALATAVKALTAQVAGLQVGSTTCQAPGLTLTRP